MARHLKELNELIHGCRRGRLLVCDGRAVVLRDELALLVLAVPTRCVCVHACARVCVRVCSVCVRLQINNKRTVL